MPDHLTGAAYLNCSKLEVLLGAELLDQVKGKRVVDFGCGEGREVIELAKRGAASVLGVEIREALREEARRNAVAAGVADRCEFASAGIGLADVVVSLDSFEHFAEPEAVLDQILTQRGKAPDRFVLPSAKTRQALALFLKDLKANPRRLRPRPVHVDWSRGACRFTYDVPPGPKREYERLTRS